MSNVLKVTTPGSGFDNGSIKNNPQPNRSEIQIQNPVDPSRVTRSDNRPDPSHDQGGNLEFHYKSNFNAFVQLMRNAPQLLDQLGDLLFAGFGGADGVMEAFGEASPAFQEALLELMELAKLLPGDMPASIKEQVSSASRFQGGLFTLLRHAANSTDSPTVKADILNFIRHYNKMSSSPHLLARIRTTLDAIKGQMYQNGRQQLDETLKDMNWDAKPGEIWQNASILKEQTLPYLSAYISSTRDMGQIRSDISWLSVLISHYEKGSMEEVVRLFDKMSVYPDVKRFLGSLSDEQLKEALRNMDFETEAGKTGWTEKFSALLKEGASGGAGLERRAAFLDMIHSLVLNESVHLPLLHLLFPMNLDGRVMTTEMWIDPDQEGGRQGADGQREPVQKLFIKFDIRNLGLFDLVLIRRDQELSIQLRYPDRLGSFEEEIRNELNQIMGRNGYRVNQVVLEKGKEPLNVLEVFPEIYERKRSVNVRV